MKRLVGILLCFCVLLIACNKSNKNSKAIIDSDKITETAKIQETTEVQETAGDLYIEAEINSDCDYYLNRSDTPSGKLTKGQSVIVLDYYYVKERNDDFIICVEIETLDKTVKGTVLETYLSYPNSHNLWFKNILLTRSYYYSESAEGIYEKDFLSLTDEGVSKKDSIIMMKDFFPNSQHRLLISERHFAIGNGGDGDVSIYKILSINKNSENTYLLNLLDYAKEKFELVLFVDNDSITITQFVTKNEIRKQYIIERALNIKYIPYNKEKSEKIKKDVSAWCTDQLRKLEKRET